MSLTSSLLTGLILGCIGMGYCLYGKKQRNKLVFWCGIGLMVLPYFFNNFAWLVATAVLVMALPKLLSRF